MQHPEVDFVCKLADDFAEKETVARGVETRLIASLQQHKNPVETR
jgi:hypothetical protein